MKHQQTEVRHNQKSSIISIGRLVVAVLVFSALNVQVFGEGGKLKDKSPSIFTDIDISFLQLSSKVFRIDVVSFSRNNLQTLKSAALLCAARITKFNGYDYFSINDSSLGPSYNCFTIFISFENSLSYYSVSDIISSNGNIFEKYSMDQFITQTTNDSLHGFTR